MRTHRVQGDQLGRLALLTVTLLGLLPLAVVAETVEVRPGTDVPAGTAFPGIDLVVVATGTEYGAPLDSHLVALNDGSGLQVALWTDDLGLWLRQLPGEAPASGVRPRPAPAVLLQRGDRLRRPRAAVVVGSSGEPTLVVVWQDGDPYTSPPLERSDVVVRVFMSTGQPVHAAIRLTRNLTGFHTEPEVLALPANPGAVVAWTKFDGSLLRRLTLRTVTVDGVPAGPLVRRPARPSERQSHLLALRPSDDEQRARVAAFVVGSTLPDAPLF